MSSVNLPMLGVVDDSKRSRITYEHGIAYYEDNMYFRKDSSCWACYKVNSYTYDFKGDRGKININDKLEKMFARCIDEEFHILDIPGETSVRENGEFLKKNAKGNLRIQGIREIENTTNYLVDTLGDKGNKYTSYLIVKMKKKENLFRNLKEYAQMVVQDPFRFLNKISGMDYKEIYRREYEIYKIIEGQIFSRVNKQCKIERIDEKEIEKLIKSPFWYGISTPPIKEKTSGKKKGTIITKNGREYIRPHTKEILRLTECDINISHPRRIRIRQLHKGKERTAYQAYLQVADTDDSNVPGGEWLYYLKENIDFPIFTSIRGKKRTNKIAREELGKKQREIEDQEKHILENPNVDMPIDVMEQKEEAIVMEYDLKTKKMPLYHTTIIIVVAAETVDELEKRIESIRNVLDDVPTEVPAGDQWLLMNECMLGGEQFSRDYVLKCTPDYLALATPGASHEVGDDNGVYAGITGSLNKPVYIAPWLPSLINKPPNATATGSQGGGKSFAIDLIALKTIKQYGAKGLFIDPKGDRIYWERDLKSFEDQVAVTVFTGSEEDFGRLDPFVMMASYKGRKDYHKMINEASLLAMDICMFLLSIDRKDPRLMILVKAVQRVVKGDKHSMTQIIRELEKMSHESSENNDVMKANLCGDMAESLNSYKTLAFSGMLFGEGHEKGVDFSKQVNVVSIENLIFPDDKKKPEDYDFQEIIGYACLLGLTGYMKKFIMMDKSLKITVVDESTVLEATPAGRNTKNKAHAMARALNSPAWFIAQSVKHLGDDQVRNNIAYKFQFKSTDPTEIDRILDYFKLEKNEENINLISNLSTGVCLFQDHNGQTAVLAIDYVYQEYFKALDTRPGSEKEAG